MKQAATQGDRLRDGWDRHAAIIVEDGGRIRLDVQQHRDGLKMKGRGQRPVTGHPQELNSLLPGACAAEDKKLI
jgi:hypothetical protein